MTKSKKLKCVGWGHRLWIVKMFFVWRIRLGYWDVDALRVAIAKKLWVEVEP
jgi:hypothetical protein